MIEIELSKKEINAPGLYLMRWNKKTGLVRVVGQPKQGFQFINPTNAAETYFSGLPESGQIPSDALFSEPLKITESVQF